MLRTNDAPFYGTPASLAPPGNLMDALPNGHLKACLQWILMISLSPLAFLLFLLMALYSLLRFLYKITLLFTIIAINTPFAIMYNLSVLVFLYNFERYQKSSSRKRQEGEEGGERSLHMKKNRKSSSTPWDWSDPRASLGIEVKLIVSDFFKVVAGELLVVVSAGIITYYTAPRPVFYASTAVGLAAILHKWLNEKCISVTALSCLCDAYGLSPLMFLFSYIGFFHIGCHPIAKCSFTAARAFLFVKDDPNRANKTVSQGLVPQREDPVLQMDPNHQTDLVGEGPIENSVEQGQSRLNEEGFRPEVPSARQFLFECEMEPIPIVERGDKEVDVEQGQRGQNEEGFGPEVPIDRIFEMERVVERGDKELDVEQGQSRLNEEGLVHKRNPYHRIFEPRDPEPGDKELNVEQGQRGLNEESLASGLFEPRDPEPSDKRFNAEPGIEVVNKEVPCQPFNVAAIHPEHTVIEFDIWNAFERGLFQLNARIKFISGPRGTYILNSFMVLKLHGFDLCEYPVERLELPEDYSKTKTNELFNFLVTLAQKNGFVTDKMRGRYEHSLSLQQITEGVQENVGYRTVDPMNERFVVAGCTNR